MTDDADFILRLLNDPDWLRFIGDKGVARLDDARRYIADGPMTMYRSHGFGLNRIALREDDRAIGICGLIQRDTLAEPDLGFALLREFRGQGYAQEAAGIVLEHARTTLGIRRIAAIVQPTNQSSARLLEKLRFVREGEISMQTGSASLDLYTNDPLMEKD